MADGKNRKRVPLAWKPGQADCVFGAWCPYPITCPFHHGRLDKPQESLQPLQSQCSTCSECLEAMQRQQLVCEAEQRQQLVMALQGQLKMAEWSCYSKGVQLDGYEGNEGQLRLMLQRQIQDLQQELHVLQGRIGQVQGQLEQFDQDKQQLDHFCTSRNYAHFKASSKPEHLECASGCKSPSPIDL